MSPTPPSTTASSASGQSPEYRVVRKRNRVPLSCAPCRHRKLKCNRSVPCENCVKRGDAASCTYAQTNPRRRATTASQSNPTSPDEMQNRIDRLEGLVLSLMTNGSKSPGSRAAAAAAIGQAVSLSSGDSNADHMEDDQDDEESDTETVTKSMGFMKMGQSSAYYISDAHWASIMSEISEIKDHFEARSKEYHAEISKFCNMDVSVPAFFFSSAKPPARSDILASIPSKYTTDVLITRYFNIYDGPNHILHMGSFKRQYEAHWQNPEKTNTTWVGQLFGMLRLAAISYHQNEDEPPEFRGKSIDFANQYRDVMLQCLSLADFTNPGACIIETLLLHMTAEYTMSKDTDVSIWVLSGIIVRLAMRMGYHREPSLFPNITPFHGEMRRRLWTLICTSDAWFSFDVSLPPAVRDGDSDTTFPRNINDDEFDEDTKILPPSRPKDEPTAMSYLISKAGLSVGLAKVLLHRFSVRHHSYDEVLALDKELREARDRLPEHLKLKSMQESQLDRAELIRARFNLVSIYHRAQCALHRKYLAASRTNHRYMNSRRTSIESSLELLRFQRVLHDETKAGGRLRTHVWYRTPVPKHDFMLAATLLAIDLYYGKYAPGTTSGDFTTFGRDMTQEMIGALEGSLRIWEELSDSMVEAYKAVAIIKFMLSRISAAPEAREFSVGTDSSYETSDEKRNAAMTLGLLSSGRSPAYQPGTGDTNGFDANGFNTSETTPDQMDTNFASNFASNPFATSGASPFNFFSTNFSDMSMPVPVDWDAWDAFIQNPGLDTNNMWTMSDTTALGSTGVPVRTGLTPTPLSPGQSGAGYPTTTATTAFAGMEPIYPITSAGQPAMTSASAPLGFMNNAPGYSLSSMVQHTEDVLRRQSQNQMGGGGSEETKGSMS